MFCIIIFGVIIAATLQILEPHNSIINIHRGYILSLYIVCSISHALIIHLAFWGWLFGQTKVKKNVKVHSFSKDTIDNLVFNSLTVETTHWFSFLWVLTGQTVRFQVVSELECNLKLFQNHQIKYWIFLNDLFVHFAKYSIVLYL